MCDQGFKPAWPTKIETRTFQSCRISCQGRDQSMPAGGPTTRRSSLRCATSSAANSCLKQLQAAPGGNPSADLQHHLQAASRAFHANHSILTNHQVSVKDRLTFFHAVVTPVACFAAGHRKILKQELGFNLMDGDLDLFDYVLLTTSLYLRNCVCKRGIYWTRRSRS